MPTGQPTLEEVLLEQNKEIETQKRVIEDAQACLRSATEFINLLISRNRNPWILETIAPSGGKAWELLPSLNGFSTLIHAAINHITLTHHTINESIDPYTDSCECGFRWTLRWATTEDHERMEAAAEEHVAGERP